ncbi:MULTISPECIES: DUF2470 domain-containing protein [Streptomyces]|uniref:DUF2470 domain-containing protein n=1 Tax=Streptomyces lasiicapitis TaxID=1923961 RepID=A0ABQ2LKN8_9ACTN|nr:MULTISPECIES: DUF2470 domain-containing protein [Streptomyces]QIB43118.1 DUF2470 domain-containing protein [Streptomyces aureoverticillatus]GGO38214.1 hypothetical protein GCM10012286_12890 [Streptomyces lasiicapitis]
MSTVAETSPSEPNGPIEPTAAERVRSVVAGAESLSLTTDGQEYDLIGMHSVSRRGRITLHPQADSPLAAQVARAPRGSLAALLEFTDIAPTAVRARVRAGVTVSGWLTPARDGEAPALELDIARVTLRTAAGTVEVGLDEMTLAAPDPLAAEEAAMLTHLTDAHEDMVAGLVALAGPRIPHGFTRAVPLALDRHGITLRYEYPSGHCDLRLLFPEPARNAADAGEQICRLLVAPAATAHLHHPSSRS